MSEQLILDFKPQTTYSAEDYIVGDFNSQAYSWIQKWPDWPGVGLILCGPQGAGKTHLSEIWRTKSTAGVLKLNSLQIAHLREALAPKQAAVIRLSQLDKLSQEQQEVLFHLYNLAKEQQNSLLLVSNTPPSRWGLELKDLESRLLTLPVATISDPDDQALSALIVKLFADRQLKVSSSVIHYLVPRMRRSFIEAQRLVAWLDNESLVHHREITMPLAKRALEIS